MGLSAGPVFLCHLPDPGPLGPSVRGRFPEWGAPGLPPAPSVTLHQPRRPALRLFLDKPAFVVPVPGSQLTHHMGAQGRLSSPPQVAAFPRPTPWQRLGEQAGRASWSQGPSGAPLGQ